MTTKFTQQMTNYLESCSTNINTFSVLANESLHNMQAISALQYAVANDFVEHSTNMAKDMLNIKTPAQAKDLFNNFAIVSIKNTLGKTKDVFNIMAKSQTTLKNIASTSLKNTSTSMLNSMNQISKFSPSQLQSATTSIQNVMDLANKANETMEKTAYKMSELANKNVEMLADATLNTIKK